MVLLVVNCGSSSLKYQVIDPKAGESLISETLERVSDYRQALACAFERIQGLAISAVGHRVVHGGSAFYETCLIDDAVETGIERCIPLAPLHNPANLAAIRAARAMWPNVPHVAVFDTAFHARLPRRAQSYALPHEVTERLSIRRYGFHGPSHSHVATRAAQALLRPLAELRIITLHLGNGASACAVEYGHSVETSMGMTPLEGLVMGSRGGDLDPGIVLALLRDGMSLGTIDDLLNRQSGLLGVSGRSSDLRDLEREAAAGDDRCRLAITVFAHRVRKYVGAYAAVMGGVDVVVLTGGIGEHSAPMRRRILQRLEFLGVVLDDDRNTDARVDLHHDVANIAADNSRVAVLVVATNEELVIARETQRLVEQTALAHAAKPIPIAISARHVHLTAETFAALFGPHKKLTKHRDLSQRGQFAANETVSLIGPRSRIDDVRILGPLRSRDQVEISRTDEFALGVDAPVRDSGHTEGSAPIVLAGPYGQVRLECGLICARRHIHMSPADAKERGLHDKDEVEVAITGGPRDLIFGDVLIRVDEDYVLEMHIDTDEGNAAELGQGQHGELVYTPVLQATAGIRSKRNPPHG